jgi:hypothetical protein
MDHVLVYVCIDNSGERGRVEVHVQPLLLLPQSVAKWSISLNLYQLLDYTRLHELYQRLWVVLLSTLIAGSVYVAVKL